MTKTVILLGHPVSQSLSPVLQNAAFGRLGLDWQYQTMDVTPSGLVAALERLEADPDVIGCNITVPHKLTSFEWLAKSGRAFTSQALQAEATNTLRRGPDGRFEGTSTDFQGAFLAIQSQIQHAFGSPRTPFDWNYAEIVILGTGGSAQTLAVGFAASLELPCVPITIYGRNLAKAQNLVELASLRAKPGQPLMARPLADFEGPSGFHRIICQTTTVGMISGDTPNASPVPAGTVGKGDIAFDLVYKPHTTRFLAEAAAHGAVIVPGIQMLINQGAQACREWLAASAPELATTVTIPELAAVMQQALQTPG